MEIYKYSKTRQNSSTVINTALKEEIFITRKDESKFKSLSGSEKEKKSPLDIEGINTDISTKEIIEILRECREGPDYFKQKYK
jgi:hypothetical protein